MKKFVFSVRVSKYSELSRAKYFGSGDNLVGNVGEKILDVLLRGYFLFGIPCWIGLLFLFDRECSDTPTLTLKL